MGVMLATSIVISDSSSLGNYPLEAISPATRTFPSEVIATLAPHSVLVRIGLSSEKAAFVTGQSIMVDGGYNIANMGYRPCSREA